MMLTVSMMSAIFIETWKTLEVSEALNRLLKVLIIAINTQSHSVYAPPPPGLGVEITFVLQAPRFGSCKISQDTPA